MADTKLYLGDAVYLELDGLGRLVLTTEDGIQATNRIVLKPETLLSFDLYREWLERHAGEVG